MITLSESDQEFEKRIASIRADYDKSPEAKTWREGERRQLWINVVVSAVASSRVLQSKDYATTIASAVLAEYDRIFPE